MNHNQKLRQLAEALSMIADGIVEVLTYSEKGEIDKEEEYMRLHSIFSKVSFAVLKGQLIVSEKETDNA